MAERAIWHFGPFHLDVGAERLWRHTEVVRLTAKAFDVLCCLLAQAGRLVTKDALFAAAWDGAIVSDAALAVCIRELRQALGDTAQTPQYVETVRGRGYRFVAPVTRIAAAVESAVVASRSPVAVPPRGGVVGREAELSVLQQCWAQAQQGARQLVMVTGEAGIGKTTLVDAFVAQVRATATLWLARGQCIEQHGAGEAYLPLLEALGRLGRGPEGAQIVAVLQQHAPSWLLHLPALVAADVYEMLQRRAGGTTQERMLRELAEAVEVLTAERPLVLVLEDLHWSDGATLDWLASVARRREAARLLVVGTYRPVDAIVREHRVRTVTQDLRLHGQATEVVMSPWPPAGVAMYLTQRFSTHAFPAGLVDVLHQRTDGNPLFLVTVMDALVQQGVVRQTAPGWVLEGGLEAARRSVPDSLRRFIERQFAQLSPEEQTMLEAASAAGAEFSAALLAAALDDTLDTVEAQCEALARRGQFVGTRGHDEWPDGTVATCYGFLHALYQEIIYAQAPVSRRLQWHRQIGARLEAAYGTRTREVAAVLAEHFWRGRDSGRAVQYLQYAGENAQRRRAHREAITHLHTALDLLLTLPDTPERATQELQVRMTLGPALMITRGFSDPEVAHAYRRVWALCQQEDRGPQRFSVLWGLWQFSHASAQIQTAQELGEQLLRLAQHQSDPVLLLQAYHALWSTGISRGVFAEAYAYTRDGMRLYTSARHDAHLGHYGVDDPGVCCRATAAQLLWLLGYPEQAVQQGQAALALARELGHPFSLAYAIQNLAQVYQWVRDVPAVQELAETSLTLGTTHGFPYVVALSTWHQGWALAAQGRLDEGLAQMDQGLTAWQALGAPHVQPLYLADMAEVYGTAGRLAAGLAALTEALRLVDSTGERKNEAELYRLQGDLLLQAGEPGPPPAETPEACFLQALDIARQQQAKSLELRAALSLSRLWQQQGKQAAAHALLAPLYGWFTEGFDTPDLQEAKALLSTLR